MCLVDGTLRPTACRSCSRALGVVEHGAIVPAHWDYAREEKGPWCVSCCRDHSERKVAEQVGLFGEMKGEGYE